MSMRTPGSCVSHFNRAAASPQARLPRRELVARVTSFLHNHLNDPLTVADLSRMAGVSQRTLRAAFHDIVGVSPKRYALTQRLHAAHLALQQADRGQTTVTDVAMTFGFFELGRFAGRYRDVFGEVPSQTLRHAIAEQPERAA